MFTELPFLDRFQAAARVGFKAVEFQFPYDHPAQDIASRLKENGLELCLFNGPPGDFAAGERGLAALPGRGAEFRASIETALDYARTMGCRKLHVMAGVPPAERRQEAETVYIANLRHAAERAAAEGVTVLLEPLNSRDFPGYFLTRSDQALAIIDRVGRDNVKLQFDFYHLQIMEGDLAEHLRRLMGRFAHIQMAGVPGRHEPDVGEINYPYLLGLVDEVGWDGWVGCEYRPKSGTLEGLGWAKRWGIDPARGR
jgi:hydroxypyruvate isomerase